MAWRSVFTIGLLLLPWPTSAQKASGFTWRPKDALVFKNMPTILKARSMKPTDRVKLLQLVIEELRPWEKQLAVRSEAGLRDAAAKSTVRLIDLNGDGIPEIVVMAEGIEAGCGAANCPLWILAQTPLGYKKLWDSRGADGIGGGVSISVQPGHGRGFRDVVLASHASAFAFNLFLERFSGGAYHNVACYLAEVSDPLNETEFSPKISPCRK